MSKKCELTGKSPLKGHRVSHANNKVKRKFLPNLKKVTFKSDILPLFACINPSRSEDFETKLAIEQKTNLTTLLSLISTTGP